MKTIFPALVLILLSGAAQAHFVWVERDGNAGARAYFGEWAHDVREKTGGALDRIKSPQVRLGAGKEALALERRDDHIEIAAKGAGDVTLVEDGLAPREDKKAGGKTRTIFHAKAGRGETQPRLDLELVPITANGSTFTLMYRGTPLAKTELTVFGPPKWEKPLRTDEQGRVAIETPWAGRYVIEATHVDEKAGEANGEKYDRVRNVFTLSFVAADGIAWSAH